MKKVSLKIFISLMFLSLSLFIYSCGGGGSSSAVGGAAGGGGAAPAGAAAANPAANAVTVADTGVDNATVVYSDGLSEIADPDCAYTYTSGGLLVCIPIDNASKESITASDVTDNETINEIADSVDNATSTKPYVVGVLDKPVKKPICDLEKNMCSLFDLKGKYPDMTVALVPYKSILAIPNQGKDAFNVGYVPITNYSGDIAVFQPNGARYGIDEIAKVLADKGVTVKVYFVFPYKSTLSSTFSSDKYKLFKVVMNNGKPSVVDTGKKIKVVEKGTDNVTFEAVLDGFYPFILAREMNPALKTVDNGSISGLKSAAITVLACDNESTVDSLKSCSAIGYDTIDSNGAYSLVYEKPSNKKLFAEVVSSYLKDNKKVILLEDLNGYSFADITSASYPSLDNLTALDKAYLKDSLEDNDNYEGTYIKNMLYPSTVAFEHDNTTVQTLLSNALLYFLNGENVSNASGEYYSGYNKSYKCTYTVTVTDNTSITAVTSCVNNPVSSSSTSSGTYSSTNKVTITKSGTSYNCEMLTSYNSSYTYSYTENGQSYTSSSSTVKSVNFTWNLATVNGVRVIDKVSGLYKNDENSNSQEWKEIEKETTNYSGLRSGNTYYVIGKGTYSTEHSTYSYSDSFEYSNKFLHTPSTKSVSLITGNLKAKLTSVVVKCLKGEGTSSITQNDIFNISQDSQGNYFVNGSKFDHYNTPNFYSVCGESSSMQ